MFQSKGKEIIESRSTIVEKVRSPQEMLARYNLTLQDYKALNDSQTDNREQRLMLYTEIKLLGWALGKPEKTVLKDINS